jgi:hypothetical protein
VSLLSFVSDNGTTFPLDGSDGIQVVDLVDGLATIPQDLIIDARVGDGGTLVSSRLGARRLALSVMLDDPVHLTRLSQWSTLQRALFAGGSLVFDGSSGQRTLYQVTLESSVRSMIGPDDIDDVFTLTVVALDPWWYGPEESLGGSTGTCGQAFGTPTAWDAASAWDAGIPWDGGAGTAVDNTGDTAAWCEVVVHPGTAAAVSVAMSIDGIGGWTSVALPMSRCLTVNGEPGDRGPRTGSARFGQGEAPILWSLLTETSQLFELPVGTSSIITGLSSPAGDGSESWNVFWSPRYLTP